MKGFVIGAYNDNGTLQGYFNGAPVIDNTDLETASFIKDTAQARAALGNLQRTNATVEMRLVPVEMTVTLVEPATSAA